MMQDQQPDATTILVVDDEPSMRTALCEVLQRTGHPVIACRDGHEALAALERQTVWLIVADLRMPRLGGLDLLREVKRRSPGTLVVLISGYATLDSAIEAIRLGASDYLLKPFDHEALEALVRRLEQANGQEQAVAADLLGTAEGASVLGRRPVHIIAQDPAMKRILQTVDAVAASQATILIQGESGTGKEVLARYLHSRSSRAHRPFVGVNCAALPEGLLESELFGCERGAFTGAVSRRPGKFEQAHGGTLLLDEISEMSLPLQAKLLRVIQEREVDRLGGKSPTPVDIRIIATTNRSLRREVESGRFREDLFYRLHVFPIVLPPLRDRPQDIVALAAHFLRSSAERNRKPVEGLSLETEKFLLRHPWKGNVRELENAIERAVLLTPGCLVLPEHFLSDGLEVSGGGPESSRESPSRMGESAGVDTPPVSIWEMERNLILRTLEQVNGNRTHAAKILDISIRTLRNKLREYREIAGASANPTGQGLPTMGDVSLEGEPSQAHSLPSLPAV
jgi:DNA-binding NtrC family response regulator